MCDEMTPAPVKHFTLQDPARFLRILPATGGRIDLRDVSLTEMFSLTAMAARARTDVASPLELNWDKASDALKFAEAVGFDEVVRGVAGAVRGEPGKTVRLTRVTEEAHIQKVAFEIARLLAGDAEVHQTALLTVEYVIIECLRNVLQHSEDALGAVVGAQRNARGLHAGRPVFQVSVADCGEGIRKTLSRTHPDVVDDDVALEQALWPYHSGKFAPGRTGGLENAGLGLFYISELAKELGGRMLLASGSSSLVVDPAIPKRIERLDIGFPGTLVAFEVPTELPDDFGQVFQRISDLAAERTPKRLTREWLKFEPPPESAQRFVVSLFVENNEEAQKLVQERVIPKLMRKEPVAFDFINVRVITQSFAHALLFEALRFAWAAQTPVYVLNAQPVVRSALHHVEMYAQAG